MKLIDKLKNALFEEEYVEIEEKPKVKPQKKEIKKEVRKEVKKEEKPIAKKIVSVEKREYIPNVKEDEVELVDEDFEIDKISDRDVLTGNNDFKFPVMEEDDFRIDPPKEEVVIPKQIERKEEVKLYQASKEKKPYHMNDIEIPKPEYGAYEKKEERAHFKPSPIISPIYGVLDKNYKKEEVVPKKEVRLTTSFSREKLDLDAIRNKAYGSLSDDIAMSSTVMENEKIDQNEDVEEDINLLLDLSNDDDTVEVKTVTVGDAEEYFQDLGLEYNVDYKDASKEKATGRRSEKVHDEIDQTEDDEIRPAYIDEVNKKQDEEDDNLFDLIDSMYDND